MADQIYRNQDNSGRIKNMLRRNVFHPWAYRIVRLALAGVFIYAGAVKLIDPRAFAAIISAYGLVPETLLPVAAIGLPLLEVIAGLALVLDRPWGLYIITGLLAVFVFVLGYGILVELDVDCGCFGAEELNRQAGLRTAFYRDLFLLGLAVPYLGLSRRFRTLAGK
jgi:uncharacterized membrane protein YphA (DoxX/SURF4 family)